MGKSITLKTQPVRLRSASHQRGMEVEFEARYSDYGVVALHSHVIILCDSRPVA